MAKITRLFKSFFRLLLPVVILLTLAFGAAAVWLVHETAKLGKCFPATTKVTTKTDLNLSGYRNTNASLDQSESYNRKVIDFFRETLTNDAAY